MLIKIIVRGDSTGWQTITVDDSHLSHTHKVEALSSSSTLTYTPGF